MPTIKEIKEDLQNDLQKVNDENYSNNVPVFKLEHETLPEKFEQKEQEQDEFSFDDFTSSGKEEKQVKQVTPLTDEQKAIFKQTETQVQRELDYIVSSYEAKAESAKNKLQEITQIWPELVANCKHDCLLSLDKISVVALNDLKFTVELSPIFISASKKFTFIQYGNKDIHARSENHAQATKQKTLLEKCFVALEKIGLTLTVKGSEFYVDDRKASFERAVNFYNSLEDAAKTKAVKPNIANFMKVTAVITEKNS